MLANLNILEPGTALHLMENLSQNMRESVESLQKVKASCGEDMKTTRAVIDLYLEMYRLFSHWTERYMRSC